MKITVKALSPIFIDSGKIYLPMQYKQTNDYLEVYQLDHVLETVKDINYFNASMLEKAIIGTTNHSRDKSFYNLNELIGPHVDEEKLKNYSTIKILNKTNATNLKKEVKETIKSLDKPYIPGSTLKGLIRTAILFDIVYKMNAKELDQFLEKVFSTYSNRFRIEDFLLNGQPDNFSQLDGKKDPYKFMEVTDAIFNNYTSMLTYVNEYPHNGRNNFPFIEAISPLSQEAFFSLKIDDIYKKYPETLNNKYAKLFTQYFETDKIFKVLYQYTDVSLNEEALYFEEESGDNNPKLIKFIKEMSIQNTEEQPIIRIGMYSGHFAHSIILAIKNDKNYSDEKYRVFEKYFKKDYHEDNAKKRNKFYKPNKRIFTSTKISSKVYDDPDIFPTTRKYAKYDNFCQLFGFAQLSQSNDS